MIPVRRISACLFPMVLGACLSARCQAPPVTKNPVAWAQDFVTTMYPRLNNPQNFITVDTGFPYAQPADSLKSLTLYVGEGFKYRVLRMQGGCTGSVVTSPETPKAEPSPPENKSDEASKKLTLEDCRPGPVYPKQFLTTGFLFDEASHIVNFAASGTFIQDNEPNRKLAYDLTMTDREIIAAIKRSGARYGPDDKAQFIKDLPLKNLERFLGTLELHSVNFHPLNPDRANLPNWPDWTVAAKATRNDGTSVEYLMTFDHVTGDLTGLCAERYCSGLETEEWLRSNKK